VKTESYLFEAIEDRVVYPAKVFLASIDHSSFHWHYEYELILVLKGSVLVNADQKPVVLGVGDIFLVNTQAIHEIYRTEEEENICLFIQISQNLFNDFRDASQIYHFYLNSKSETLKPKKEFRHFIKMAAQIGLNAIERNENTAYRIKGMLYLFIADLYQYTSYDIYQRGSETAENENMEILMNIIDYIQIHYQDENVLGDLYKKVGMSEKSVYRLLKINIGFSVKELVLSRKLDKAKYLLKYTDKPINCIVDECGFHSEKTFYRTFRKVLSITPNEYRKHGIVLKDSREIKGYLDFNQTEGRVLLENIVQRRC